MVAMVDVELSDIFSFPFLPFVWVQGYSRSAQATQAGKKLYLWAKVQFTV